MRFVVDAAQMTRVDVAVHLRRRERAVSEQLLDRAEIRTAVEQVRGERVAQPVRVGDDAAQRARVEASAASRQEEGVVRSRGKRGPGVAEVARQPERRLLAERDDSLLAA